MLYLLAACLVITDGEYEQRRDDARSCEPVEWYPDEDGDGWGDGEPTSACDAPDGTADNDEDCDDDDAGVNPDAAELCDNGVDDDCDGTPGDCTDY